MLFTEKLKIKISGFFLKVNPLPTQWGRGGKAASGPRGPLQGRWRGRWPGPSVRGRGEARRGQGRRGFARGAGQVALRQRRRRLTEARRAARRARQRGPRRSRGVPGAALSPAPTPHPAGSRMGARASGGPRARAGLPLLLLLLLGLLAPGAQGARGRGGTEKNSYRRTVNTFSQSVSSLFGEDNVRAAQKVGAGLEPAVTLPRPPRTWLPGPAWAVRGLRGCLAAGRGERGGRPASRGLPPAAPAAPAPGGGRDRRPVPARVGGAGPWAPFAQRPALLLGP